MDTPERIKTISRFVVLIPHNNSLKPLEEYRTSLFAASFPGAYSFPAAAPLAAVSKPFSREELKALAANIRERCSAADGKIRNTGTAFVRGGGFSFFGIGLDFPLDAELFPSAAKDRLLSVFAAPVLCAALAGTEQEAAFPPTPALAFRAAALANLAIRPLPGSPLYSFEWKMGARVWLAKRK